MSDSSSDPIRDRRSAAHLSRTFSRSLTAVDLAEPLPSLDASQPADAAATLMQKRNLTVLGVRRDGVVAGWVRADDLTERPLGEIARPFHDDDLLDETAGLDLVLGCLSARPHAFIRWLGDPAAVITRRDLQKPPLRMWLFGAITILDLNMTCAIEALYPGESWRERISKGRLEKALALQTERQRSGSDCKLVDCLQIKDKADILVRAGSDFALLGFSSKREADRISRDIESLRNHLAHAQKLEEEHLATAARLADFITPILHAEGVQRLLRVKRQEASGAGPGSDAS